MYGGVYCKEDICGEEDICPVRELVFKLGHEDCFDPWYFPHIKGETGT